MNIQFFWVGGPTFIIKVNEDFKFACDPILASKGSVLKFKGFDSTRVIAPKYNDKVFQNVDLWLLTHGHLDHIDSPGKEKIDSYTEVIACENVDLVLEDNRFKHKKILKWNENYTLNIKGYEICVTAIPAYHGNNIIIRKIVGKVNGYTISIKKGVAKKIFYITSDTVYHKDIIKCASKERIDYMIANLGEVLSKKMGGPLTMSVDMLKKINHDLNIDIDKTIPIHFDDFSHYETTSKDLNSGGYEEYTRGEWVEL